MPYLRECLENLQLSRMRNFCFRKQFTSMTPALQLEFSHRIRIALFLFLLVPQISQAASVESDALQPAKLVLQRLIPSLQSQVSLSQLQRNDRCDEFQISGTTGNIRVAATSNVAALFGVNWYFRHVAHLQISPNGDQLGKVNKLPEPSGIIEKKSCYAFRYALNENTDGYSTPYWDWPRWEHEIDVLAFSGMNTVPIERGADAILYQTFRDFGYSDTEIRYWIAQPAHQNWQLMGNLCCFDEPVSRQLLNRRVQSAKNESSPASANSGSHPFFLATSALSRKILPCGIRVRMLSLRARGTASNDPHGSTRVIRSLPKSQSLSINMSANFSATQPSTIWNLFQEGGTPGDVPVSAAANCIQKALQLAHPGAL